MSRFGNLGPGIRPKLRNWLGNLENDLGLPFIKGTWYFVDPQSGDSGNDGKSPSNAVASIVTAYGLCTSGAGDGICLISKGTTSAHTTSYLDSQIAWSKNAITVVGVSSGTAVGGRARISSKVRTTGALTTLAFVDTSGVYTITDSASGFVTAGFVVGSTIEVVANSGTNDGTYTITAVAAGTLTVTESVTTENAATAGSTTITSYQAQLLNVSGDNNSFYNIHVANYGTSQYAVGAMLISGNRNNVVNCHLYGAGNATPAATTGAFDLKLNGGQENTFERCTFGSDTIIRAAANGNISFDSNCWRNHFYDCNIVSYSATAGKGAIISADATAIEGTQIFARCRFINWNPNGLTALTSAFIGTKPTSGYILMDSCSLMGWAAWDSVAANNTIYVANSDATASGAGGIATTI